MLLFILPLAILTVGYGAGLWLSLAGRHLTRRFFVLPLVASLLITGIFTYQYRRAWLAPPPGRVMAAQPEDPTNFLPLYALRVAPIVLGVCLIVNAAGFFTVTSVHRRYFKRAAPGPGA